MIPLRHIAVTLTVMLGAALIAMSARGQSESAIYSDVCLHPQEHELLGDRLTVTTTGNLVSVKLEHASGEWMPPVYGSGTTQGSAIVFIIDDGNRALTFRGTITAEAVEGAFDQDRRSRQDRREFRLRRIPSASAEVPVC